MSSIITEDVVNKIINDVPLEFNNKEKIEYICFHLKMYLFDRLDLDSLTKSKIIKLECFNFKLGDDLVNSAQDDSPFKILRACEILEKFLEITEYMAKKYYPTMSDKEIKNDIKNGLYYQLLEKLKTKNPECFVVFSFDTINFLKMLYYGILEYIDDLLKEKKELYQAETNQANRLVRLHYGLMENDYPLLEKEIRKKLGMD